MRSLSAHDILRVWDRGQGKHAVDRALLLLAPAFPEMSADALAALSIGQRNARLLRLRQRTLGSMMNAVSECPNCSERLEFSVDVDQVCIVPIDDGVPNLFAGTFGDIELTYRPVDSRDLAAVAAVDDPELARELLMERCLVSAVVHGEAVMAHELGDDVLAALAEAIAEVDPQAEVRIRLDCVKCGHSWASVFDIVTFFWTEVSTLAERLFADVHQIARAYGWRESEILSMSANRRQAYLERIG